MKRFQLTTLIAFEWTSIPNGRNMHRNVFFRDDKGPSAPYSPNKFLAGPMDARYAARQQAHEPLTEIIQTKGQSDTHPAMSPNDDFAEFEMYKHLIGSNPPVVSKVGYSFVRQALINGLGHEQRLGVNPFKFAIVSGADAHTCFSDSEEFNYTGVHGVLDNSPKVRLSGSGTTAGESALAFGTPGATGVWADENTREGTFDGIVRKESFGTSGPMIRVRFFGGWEYPADLASDSEWVKKAYQGGVPMGGDLPARKGKDLAKAPSFVVWALKDPVSGNLDRVQIIKGWQQNGYGQEKIFDVSFAGDRKVDPKTGKLPPIGSTVDVKSATYTNDIGAANLSAVWTDPDFDPEFPAVYYVRVLEIPTPRWSTYDAKALGIDPSADVPAVIQERAWSSPIWYTPAKGD